MADKDQILSILEKFASKDRMGSFLIDNTTSDFLLIRPSGNPIEVKGLAQMWSSGDLVLATAEITKVRKFDFQCDEVAMCIFTMASKFTYKGTPNDDFPTVTSIFKRINGS